MDSTQTREPLLLARRQASLSHMPLRVPRFYSISSVFLNFVYQKGEKFEINDRTDAEFDYSVCKLELKN